MFFLKLSEYGNISYEIQSLGIIEQDTLFFFHYLRLLNIDNENLILEGVIAAQKDFNIKSTPSFVINGNLKFSYYILCFIF